MQDPGDLVWVDDHTLSAGRSPNDITYWVAQLGLGLQILPLETKQVFSLFSVSERNASKTICTALEIENNAGLTLDQAFSVALDRDCPASLGEFVFSLDQ